MLTKLFGISDPENATNNKISQFSSLKDNGYYLINESKTLDNQSINGQGIYINVIGNSVSNVAGINGDITTGNYNANDSKLFRFILNNSEDNAFIDKQCIGTECNDNNDLNGIDLYESFGHNRGEYYNRQSTSTAGILLESETNSIKGLSEAAMVNVFNVFDSVTYNNSNSSNYNGLAERFIAAISMQTKTEGQFQERFQGKGINNMQHVDSGTSSFGGKFSARSPNISASAFIGGKVIKRDEMDKYTLSPAEKIPTILALV